MWDGNVWQPIGVSVGEIVLAGTYDASTNLMATVTSEGTSLSYTVGSALPAASSSNKGYYVVVSEAGTGTSPAPEVALNPPDFLLSTGTAYTEIDVSSTVVAQTATNVAFTAAGNIASTNVQAAIEELDTEKVGSASPTFTGTVALGEDAVLTFEGATDNAFETTLTVVDPTADRSLSLPNISGTLVSSGDTGTVTSTMILDGTIANADISASAEIAVSKLANGTARQLLQTDVAGTGVEFTSNVDVPGTLDVTGAATLDSTLGVTGLISADGKVKFPAGTASAPSFYSGTDTNTGLYFSAADEVSITTGGTQRVVVDSSGRLGVGESSPLSVLHVKSGDSGASAVESGSFLTVESNGNSAIQMLSGTSSNNYIYFGDSGDTNTGSIQYSHGANALIFRTNGGNERARIDSSGRLMIQNTSAGSLNAGADDLVVGSGSGDQGITIYTGSSSQGSFYFADGTSGAQQYAGGINYSHSDNELRFLSSGSTNMRLDSSGRLLVGASSARTNFDNGSITSNIFQVERTASGGNAALSICGNATGATVGSVIYMGRTRATSTGGTTVVQSGDLLGRISFQGADGSQLVASAEVEAEVDGTPGANDMPGRLVFSTTADGAASPTERCRIDSAGRLLVGTTSLIDSSSASNFQIANSSGARLCIARNNTTVTGGNLMGAIDFFGNDSNGTYEQCARIIAEADGTHGTGDKPTRLALYTTADGSSTATEAMRIDSKQRVTVKAGAIAEIDTLNSASTVTPDFATSCNFTLTLGTNVTLANPDNVTAGQSGSIFLVQDGTGSRTLTLGSNYDFAGGTAPTLSTAANAVDRLDYIVRTSTSIHCVVTLAYS